MNPPAPAALRVGLGLALVVALGLDIAGLHGHLGFVLPCTLFALLLLAVPWSRGPARSPAPLLHLPAPLTVGAETTGDTGTAAGETQLLPPVPPPLPGMMAVIDTEHRCAAASPALARWLGAEVDMLTGRGIAEVMGTVAAATLVPQVEAALGGSLRRVRCAHVGSDGTRRWLQVELQPRIDEYGERIGCDLLAMDVTPEHRRLEKLQRSDRRLRGLLAQLPMAVSYVDTDFRCRYANAAQADWLGRPEDEITGKTLPELLGEAAFAAMKPNLEAALAGEVVPLERYRVDGEGHPEWQAGQHAPDLDEDGRVLGVYTVFQDITARMLAEQQLRRQPELAAEAPTAALAVDPHADPEDPAAPPVLGLQPPLRPGPTPQARLDDLLDLPGLEPGTARAEVLDFDLVQLVEDTVQLHAPKAQAKGLELACRIDHRLPAGLRGDPHRLHQLLTILLGNAVTYTTAGDVLVDVQRAGADAVRWAVHDTGPGLDAARCARLLADPSASAAAEALGVPDAGPYATDGTPAGRGLEIARQLVALLGGRLGVESTPGHGSTFWITLPLEVADTVPPMPPAEVLAGRHVLVVDDNSTHRQVLEHLLEGAGLRCTLADGGAQALELLAEARDRGDPPDLALVDLQMPGQDGIDLAAALRDRLGAEAPRVVLMTPLRAPGGLARAREVGIAAHVGKPVRRHDLLVALAQALGPRAPAADPARAEAPSDAWPAPASPNAAAPAPSTPALVVHARVLLADDSGVNQVVTQSMLETLGCDFRIVSNGEAALEAMRREHFDLVLMDSDMPVLDGHATTRAIRLREQQLAVRRIPVIALTASALVSEVEPCHTAGMDDHLTRPYTRQQLVEVLQRWLPPELIERPGDTPDPSAAPAPARPGADAATAQAMRAFLDALPGQVGQLRQQVDAGDAVALVPAAQALALAALAVGAGSLATMCHQLEQMGASGDLTGAAGRVAALEAMADCIAPVVDHPPRLAA